LRECVRKELWPTAVVYVWDSIRRDVNAVWTASDLEHTNAKRGWLAQGQESQPQGGGACGCRRGASLVSLTHFASDPAAFRDALILRSAHGCDRFGVILADFQRRDFAATSRC
jgi:hypothetical protein